MQAHDPSRISYKPATTIAESVCRAFELCRKYSTHLYPSTSNRQDSSAEPAGRAQSVQDPRARPPAGHVPTMNEHATGSGFVALAQEATASQTNGSEKRLVTDGGVDTSSSCPHLRIRRYGRVDGAGDAVVERRCADCGRTLSMGGSR